MTPRRLQFGFGAFAILSAGVMFNAFYLQGARRIAARNEETPPSQVSALLIVPAAVPTAAGPATETISAIQRELDQAGYGIGLTDGIASPVTRAAIYAYEADHGVPLTAEPSEDLLRTLILGAGMAPKSAPPSSGRLGPQAEKLVASVRQMLTARGYGPLPASGPLNDAITRFERDQKLPQTGKISAPLVARLTRLAAQGPVSASR